MDAEAIIIGSGAGGGAAAWRLATQGVNVLVLEAGPRFDPLHDYKQDQDDWETSFPSKSGSTGPYDVADLQLLTEDTADIRSWNAINGPYVPGDRRVSFGYHHVRGIGGSSLHFTGEAHRMNPRSMHMKSDHGVAADWPLSYADLDPYWQIAEETVGVAGPENDLRCPRSAPFPMKEHRPSFSSQTLAQAARVLGLSPTPNSLAVLSEASEDRPACNYCGGCLRGCMLTDKGSIDVTYLRRAEAMPNFTIKSGVEVLKLESDGNSISGVVAMEAGQQVRYTASIVIVACGAIQTPRLLLNSANTNSPDGLANDSGQVGRNFMETLLTTTSALHPENLGSHRGLPVDWVAWDFNAPDSIPGVIGGCRFGPAMAESDLVGPVAYASRVVDGWGLSHKRAMRQAFGRVVSIAGLGESLPNDNSYVDLSERTDQHGLPVARIHSYLDDMALKRLRFMTETCRNIVAASGASDVFEEFSSVDAFSSTHVFGTCRMGESEDDSVVDQNCRSHRWPNLFVVDASVFPSSGGGESPGLTIQALALRAMDRLIKKGVGT